MPRAKEFDPTDVLDKAMCVFWHKGYYDTSVRDLVEAMGINRFSIYSTFEDKHTLFLHALDHYQRTRISRMLAVLEQPEASVAEVHTFFEQIVAGARAAPDAKYGCLMVNTAAEMAADDPEAAQKVQGYLDRLTQAFRHALDRGRRQDELAEDFDIDGFAAYLTGVVLGLSTYMKTPASHDAIATYVRTALAPIV